MQAWKTSILEVIINDMKEWPTRDGWWYFCMAQAMVFVSFDKENIFRENKKVLT